MKILILVSALFALINHNLLSQEKKKNLVSQILKEDTYNLYQSDQITTLDLLQGLEVAGVTVRKFTLGQFDKKYKFSLLVDEFVDGKLTNSDTIFALDNEYHYYERGTESYFLDYIDQLKIFTKEQDESNKIFVSTYAMQTHKELKYKIEYEDQFYNWRNYSDTHWKLNAKVPLTVLASSWKDKKHGFQRFCGSVNLSEGDERTDELLNSSPHYYVIYYIVRS